MEPVNISCIQWIPKKFCNKHMFYSHYDNNDNNVVESNDDRYMYMALDNEITNGNLLENNLTNHKKSNDERDYFDDDNLSDSCLSIEDSDRILVAGTNYEDSSSLEVVLYNTDSCGLETHHEILLNGYPLCMKLIPRQNYGVLASIGTFTSDITIWDIYDIDLLEPLAILSNDNQKTDKAIISLDYDSVYLAAGSEDHSIYIWDLEKQHQINKIQHHNDKVQIVKWHNTDPNLLVSAAFDNKLLINDLRKNSISSEITLTCDVECAVWYKDTESILIGFENGDIRCYDMRMNSEIWSINNSKKPCTTLGIRSNVLVASSLSGSINIYKINEDNKICLEPKQIYKKKLGAGPIFTSSISIDDEYTFGFGCEVIVIADLLSFDGLNDKIK